MSQIAKLTAVQAAIINSARNNSSDDERKQIKREVFSVVKAKFGIPETIKVKANTTGVDQPGYLVLHATGTTDAFALGDDGKWNGTMVPKAQPAVTAALPGCNCADDLDLDVWGLVYGDEETRLYRRID